MKNIIICCDGTGNEYGENNTNVVTTYELSEKHAGQVCYYDPGVGAGKFPGWKGKIRKLRKQATGSGLQKNVNDAYRFLMQVYELDDRVYLFGFSRGAFTVRSLAGMLHKVGLLPRHTQNLVENAAKLYNKPGDDAVDSNFKGVFCKPCPVHFIGVWDTVESLAQDAGKNWHDAKLNPEVKFAYHAIAIDERRKNFPPTLWDEKNLTSGQTMEQVWFAGVHSDVGGWYDERGLSNCALHWMLSKAQKCGMDINESALQESRHREGVLDEMHESRTGFWKLIGKHVRKIPSGAKIHRSVKERMDGVASYRPEFPEKHTSVD